MNRFEDRDTKAKGTLSSLKDKKNNDNVDVERPVLLKKENDKQIKGFHLSKEDIEKLQELKEKSGLDNSAIVSEAIRYFYDNVRIK